jgi:hypothetical protein
MEFGYADFTRYDIDLLLDMSLIERASWHAEWSEVLLAGLDGGHCPWTPTQISAAHAHAQLPSAWAAIAAVCPHADH